MTQTISGNLSGPARIIILNESDMTIEHNATASGSFEVSGLSDGLKTILARKDDGETFGYAAVSGTAVAGATYLMTVNSESEYATEFSDESSSYASTDFRDTGIDAPALFIGVQYRSDDGRVGANTITNRSFSTSEKVTFEVDWKGTSDSNWYDQSLGNATNYIAFVAPGDYSYLTTAWGYHHIRCTNGIFVNLRSRGELVTLGQGPANSSNPIDAAILNNDTNWRPVKIELDWPNEHLKIWVDGILRIDEDMAVGLKDSIGSEFKINFHWNSFRESGTNTFRDLKLYTGEKNVAGDVGTLLEITDCTSFTNNFFKITSGTLPSCTATPAEISLYGNALLGWGGSNIVSRDIFPTTGISTITFDWYPTSSSNWYDDQLSNSMNFIWFANPVTWEVDLTSWHYHRPDLKDDGFSVHLRTNLTTYTLNTQTTQTESAITYLYGVWRPVEIIVNWNTGTLQVSVDDTPKINTTLNAANIAGLTNGFLLGFHWHSYNNTGDVQKYKNIKLVQS